MNWSGVILDAYDDKEGKTFLSFYPRLDAVPEAIKTASSLNQADLDRLPDQVFALVMVDDEAGKIRKYACVDEGGTGLSVLYFVANHEKLPLEAQIKTAENLKIACGWYHLTPPAELDKIAGIADTLSTAQRAVFGLSAGHEALQGMHAASGVMDGVHPGEIISPEEAQERRIQLRMGKYGEASQTAAMNIQPTNTVIKDKMPPLKTAADVSPDINEKPVKGQQGRPPETHMDPYVDVSGKRAPVKEKKAEFTRFALGTQYPLDDYAQVKTATAYFDKYKDDFTPSDRHEYAVKVAARARELLIPVSDDLRKFGSTGYAPEPEIRMALDLRKTCLEKSAQREVLDRLMAEKPRITPDLFCATLEQFDKVAELDALYVKGLPDAWATTYGFEKKADFSWVDGNDYVNEGQLQRLAAEENGRIHKLFDKDVAKEFKKSPVDVFKSMPVPQKRIIARLATDDMGRSG